MLMKFRGYKRVNGRIGVRNYLAVIPSVFCANKVAEKIAQLKELTFEEINKITAENAKQLFRI